MKKILVVAAALAVFCSPALAGKKNKNNQFENWQHNQQYTETYNYNYNYNYKYKNNNNNEAWAAVGGFIGGFVLGNMGNGYEAPPVYVPPAYVVPGQVVEQCGTVWTMEPDGFGGWQRTPHTVCGY